VGDIAFGILFTAVGCMQNQSEDSGLVMFLCGLTFLVGSAV